MKKFTYSITIEVEAENEDIGKEKLQEILVDECPDFKDPEQWILRKTSEDGISYDLETGRITDEEVAAAVTGNAPITQTIKEKAAAIIEEALAKNEKDITGTLLVLEMLREAFRMDPVSVHILLSNRVGCSRYFAKKHPHIECAPTNIDPDRYTVSTLGYINGLLSVLNQGRVCMVFRDLDDGESKVMTDFDIYEPDKPRDYKSKEWKNYIEDHREALIELSCIDDLEEEEIQEALDSIDDRYEIIYRLSTYFFDNCDGHHSPSGSAKEWVRKKFPDLYTEALDGFLEGRHDT